MRRGSSPVVLLWSRPVVPGRPAVEQAGRPRSSCCGAGRSSPIVLLWSRTVVPHRPAVEQAGRPRSSCCGAGRSSPVVPGRSSPAENAQKCPKMPENARIRPLQDAAYVSPWKRKWWPYARFIAKKRTANPGLHAIPVAVLVGKEKVAAGMRYCITRVPHVAACRTLPRTFDSVSKRTYIMGTVYIGMRRYASGRSQWYD